MSSEGGANHAGSMSSITLARWGPGALCAIVLEASARPHLTPAQVHPEKEQANQSMQTHGFGSSCWTPAARIGRKERGAQKGSGDGIGALVVLLLANWIPAKFPNNNEVITAVLVSRRLLGIGETCQTLHQVQAHTACPGADEGPHPQFPLVPKQFGHQTRCFQGEGGKQGLFFCG